jgi:hypothetical protein
MPCDKVTPVVVVFMASFANWTYLLEHLGQDLGLVASAIGDASFPLA